MSTPMLLRLDSDDSNVPAYRAIHRPPNWAVVVAKRDTLSAIYNGFLWAMPDLPWYGVLGDDVVPETQGWDRKLIEAAGRDGLAFGDDGINGDRHATHFVVGGDLARKLGWLALPGLERLYIDSAWNEVTKGLGVRRFVAGVTLRHYHFSNNLAMYDKTYQKPGRERDKARYETWLTEWRKTASSHGEGAKP